MPGKPDLIGQRFGKWTVVGGTMATFGGRLRHLWDCRCDCGTLRGVPGDALVAGKTTQCRDCGNREKAALKPRLTHGGTDTRLYQIWTLMRRRCSNQDCEDYPRYGGRGISVTADWNEFAPFRDWALSHGYRDDLTLDREDNNKGYDPGNCRWINRTAQNRNRRNNQRFEWHGQRLMLSEIAEMEGLSQSLLRQRVRRDGLSLAEAISRPVRTHPSQRKI